MPPPRRPGGPPTPSSPGLAKVRKVQVISQRSLELFCLREGWWSNLLERADLVSEGGSVKEGEERVYYGSTSLRALVDEAALRSPRGLTSAEQLLGALLADPHARLRLLRLAHREAVVRADAPIHVLQAEIVGRVLRDEEGVWLAIDVDVSAELAVAERDAM